MMGFLNGSVPVWLFLLFIWITYWFAAVHGYMIKTKSLEDENLGNSKN